MATKSPDRPSSAPLAQSQAAELLNRPAGDVAPPVAERLASLDAFRGATMLLMASSGFGIAQVAKSVSAENPDTWWRYLAALFEHVPWVSGTNVPESLPFWGLSPWDLIQPAFMLMVGVALPFSVAKRRARGDSFWGVFGHAVVRAVVLVLLGVFLSSNWSKQTNWAFMNVLSQIGLGYIFLFLLAHTTRSVQIGVIVFLLVGHGYAYFSHPIPPETEWAALGVTDQEREQGTILTGVMAPWSKHLNFGADFDRKFLNAFPREKPYVSNDGGYQSLNWITSLATMLLGLLAGDVLRRPISHRERLRWLCLTGLGMLAVSLVLGFTLCPIVKRIWTPTWVLYSGGLVYLLLAGFYALIDVRGWRAWSFPFIVVGMNSITMYLMSQLIRSWTGETLKRHLGAEMFAGLYGPIVERSAILLVFWLVCLWLYRQKIFFRI